MSGAIVGYSDVRERDHIEDDADVVIIGSGAAGATAARVLTERGLDVIVLEEGPRVKTSDLRSDMYTTFKRLWRDMGFQVAQGKAFSPILQGRCVGGTTVINGAIIHRMPEKIHAAWCADRGVEATFSYAELTRVWDQMDRELSVGTAPLKVLGRNNALMQIGIEEIGATGNFIRRNVVGCRGSSHCNQGCPTAQKQSMNETYVPRAVEAGARVYADCRAERVLTAGGRAVGVTGRFLGPGAAPAITARARHAVIVAASAIQTPLFLRDNGIGRATGLVGERLQAHPGTGVSGVFDEPVEIWFGATQGFESVHFWDERMKFETVGMPLEFGTARIPGFGETFMRRMANYGHVAIWGLQVRARAHGRVSRNLLGQKRIEYELTEQDVRVAKLGVKRLTRMMFAAGAREVFPGVHGLPESIDSADGIEAIDGLPDDPRLFHCICAHLFGTAVMGQSPHDSVVDLNLEAHDLRGLFVTDSSVFPTNMGVNPQHVIAAVSWLAAERIADGAVS